jgi:hypothetical protein
MLCDHPHEHDLLFEVTAFQVAGRCGTESCYNANPEVRGSKRFVFSKVWPIEGWRLAATKASA